jgi:5-methylcytosine-specific restriction endonuclease McrA
MSQREHRQQYGRSLAVHHRVPRKKFETAAEAHDLQNLVTLCSPCHGRIEGRDDDRVAEAIEDVRPLEDIREENIDVSELRERINRLESKIDQ